MNWESIIIPSLSGMLGVVGTLMLFALKIGKYVEKIVNLEKTIEKVSMLEKYVSALQEFQKNAPQIFVGKSPLGLTIYAETLLKDVEFQEFFKTVREKLVEKLDLMQLKTRYDVQEKSKELLQQVQNEDIFIPLKTKAYDKGKNYDHIMQAGSIPLRDYYLEQHPEIKD